MTNSCLVEQSTLFKNAPFWSAPTIRIRPSRGEIQIWLAPIGFDAVDTPQAWKCLSSDERARAGRFASRRNSGLFVRSRYQLRLLLANCLGMQPHEVEFNYSSEGKPRLKEGGGLQFNLSRSRDTIAVALTMEDEIGVDLELIDPRFDVEEIACAYFCADEMEFLNSLEEEQRPGMIYRMKTAKKALIKGAGKGGDIDPRSVVIGWNHSGELVGYVDGATGQPRTDWMLNSLQFSSGGVISVASPGESKLLVYQV